eukprot:m.123293 g.123293  ORF g.123293 m.123293 type:complete len:376 (+) comp23384_c0_seq1:207-1334(+)
MLRHQCMYTPHLECPDRILGIMKELKTQGLAEQCVEVEPRDCTRDELLLVHTINHCDQGEKIADMNQDQLNKLAENFNSIYLNPGSVESADRAAGSLLAVTEKVVKGELENGVAVIRPPGHHAEADFPMGFCIHNSVAVAAAKARKDWGVNRVLIVDWDVHHGNGTQHMFEDDPSVLYFSTHRYDNGFFYPNSNDADPTTVGKGAGAGFSVNVGWNQRAMGDVEYLMAWTHVLMPIALEFQPELVLISAGFDAALGDPLGGCSITPEGYANLIHMLLGLAGGKLVMALEGGYNIRAISASFAACTSVLLGDPVPSLDFVEGPNERAMYDIQKTILAQSKYWKLLLPLSFASNTPDKLEEDVGRLSLDNQDEEPQT